MSKNLIVGFVGIDGTGKTTQARMLQHTLRVHNLNAKYVHLFSTGSTISSKLSSPSIVNRLLKTLDKMSNTRAGAILELIIRLPSIILESWITLWTNRSQNEIVIYDRYFYDKIIAVLSSYTKILNAKIKRTIITLAKFVSEPDVTVILLMSPREAIMRKRGHSLREAKEICTWYKELSHILSIRPVDAGLDVHKISGDIKEIVLQALKV